MSTINKSFIIDFDETAIDKHAVPASSVAQSLLSLLALLQSISKQLFGKQSVAEVKIKSGSHPGSFLVDLSIENPDEDLIRLNKFVFGKSAKPKDQHPEEIRISVKADNAVNANADLSSQIDCVLKDTTSEVLLTVVSPMLNGNRTGWRFSEGDGSSEFSADVIDDEFLQTVKTDKISWTNGTCLLAFVRSLQVKTNDGFKTKRTVLKIKEVIKPLSSSLSR
ncbi:hypothetical protein [Parasutterella excrementihominis]|jgi:hypothetical protein|uniref:hypothetical protein n=1 Tax=Parasutterella excrementihominis TaxID=487175 RepID=UPI003A919789